MITNTRYLSITTEYHVDPLVPRLTGIFPSDAVVVIDISNKKFDCWLDSRYIELEVTPRSWWTWTKYLRPSHREFLNKKISYTISPLLSIQSRMLLEDVGISLVVDTTKRSDTQRIIKSQHESELMKICYAKSLQVVQYIQSQIDDNSIVGKSCLRVRGECIAYAMSLWLSGESFDMIVATWVQTASPHHETDNTPISSWALLIDMGRKRKWYCSDMTRSWRIGETVGVDYRTRKNIYDCVFQAKQLCEQYTRVWMTGIQVDALAREYISERWYGEFFTHSTGHGIGLQVHEFPRITSSYRGDNTLEVWMFLTIEPWIYLPWKFGVRIEDTYSVQSNWLGLL